MTFPQQWLVDEEVIKDSLKKCRNLHKTLCLGLSYGMGPKKLLQSAYEIGEELSKEQAAAFYRTYWRIFKGVKKLDKALAQHYKRTGRLQTSFGYCVYPDADYKAFNAFIQATVSGIMHSLNADFFERCNFARFITVIHDELLVEIPTDRLAEAKELWRQSVEWLNRGLKWNVKIRTGWVEGTNWFTAK
jgi:DNA polymerase I-like protein with 3'-5' exonuclease and polymerase domains